MEKPVQVFLSRSNLEALLSKLDRNKETAGVSACTLVKKDTAHERFAQTHETILVTAVEDAEYYDGTGRSAGLFIHPADK